VTVGRLMAYKIWLGVNGQRELRHATYGNINRDNVITPTLNTPTFITPTLITPTIITPTLNTSTVTDSLCNSGAFSNPNAVRDCPFNLKGAWFLSRSRKFFSYAALLFLKLFSAAQQNIFYKGKYYFI
jgi:hypothetical protein